MTVVGIMLTVLIAISWEFIISKGFEVFLRHSVSKFTGKNLVASGFSQEKEQWVLNNPRLCEEGCTENVHFKASKAIFSYTIDLWKREINLYITFEEPELRINRPDSDLQLWLKNLEAQTGLFELKSHVAIHNGNLHLGDSLYEINGELVLGPSYAGNLHIDFKENNHFFINFVQDGTSAWDIDFQCKEVQCAHLHHCVSYIYPELQNLIIHEGVLHGSGGIILRQHARPLIYGEATLARLNIEHVSTRMRCYLKEVGFHVPKNLGEGSTQGNILFYGEETLAYPIPKNSQEITMIAGSINFGERSQAKISLRADYNSFSQSYKFSIDGNASLPMQADLAWNIKASHDHEDEMHGCLKVDDETSEKVQLSLNGKLKNVLKHIADEVLRKKLSGSFAEDEFAVTTHLKKSIKGVEISGLVKIIGTKGEEKPGTFGFELSSSHHLYRHFDSVQTLLPGLASHLINSEKHPRKDEGIYGYYIKNGWFQASGLPLEKYLAPFFIDEKFVKLTGLGDFKGRFDQRMLNVAYEGHHVKLENDAFTIEADEIRPNPFAFSLDQSLPEHEIDFDNGEHFGSLPLINATYLEKNSGLLFTDIAAHIEFEGNNIHMPTIESFCNGIYLEGSLDVDLNELHTGCFNVQIRPQIVHGKVTQVQSFFSHLHKPLFFLKIPLEGEVTLHPNAGHLHFGFSPVNYEVQAYLRGSLAEGMILSHDSNVSLNELSLNFEYDHRANLLDFSDIQGTLLVGEPEKVEEYTVIGEKIHFSDFAQNRAAFDLWIGDKKRDVIRLAGETYAPKANPEEDFVQFALDPKLSHFGNVYPQTFHLILKDWWQVHEFSMVADFKLGTFFQDLQRFSRTGFLFLSPHSLKQLNDIKKAEGNFTIDINYDHAESQLDYHMKGEDVAIDSLAFKNVLLEGRKSDDTWIIDQLVADQVSIAADILRKPGSWFINFLGLRLGKGLLMGLQGEYFDDSRIINGKINLLEVDLAALKDWPKADAFLQKYSLKGNLRASGPFHYEFSSHGTCGSKLEASLMASIKDWGFKGLHFDDINQVALHYASDKGLTISKVNTALKSASGGMNKVVMNLEKLDYNISQDAFSLKNLDFVIASPNILQVMNQLAQGFPTAFSPVITEMMGQGKQIGNLEGSLSLDYADPHYGIKLALKEGQYQLFNKRFLLSDIVLEYDPCEFKMIAKCLSHAVPFWMQYKSSCVDLKQGELILSDESPDCLPANPLTIKWLNSQEQGLFISQALGYFQGMTFALSHSPNKEINSGHCLDGEVKLNAKKAMALIAPELDEMNQWQIGSDLILKGHWSLQSDNDTNELIKTHFFGHLEAHNFEFKGYQLNRIYAEMKSSPNQVFLNNIRITDPCGNFKITELSLQKYRNDMWQIFLLQADGQNFTPGLLQKNGIEECNNSKPLVIREFSLRSLQGILGNVDSFSGKGSLEFVNPPKKNTNYPLFAVPGEILSRLGLDAAVLNPVVGTIFYDVRNSKIFLTKLKDTYSQGKMSKFYLPASHKSYIDFDGNLHLQIKMRQYNLFFKLAELFTVTVQGTWQKPTYTLQKTKK